MIASAVLRPVLRPALRCGGAFPATGGGGGPEPEPVYATLDMYWTSESDNVTGQDIERSTDATTWTINKTVAPEVREDHPTVPAAGDWYYQVVEFNPAGRAVPTAILLYVVP